MARMASSAAASSASASPPSAEAAETREPPPRPSRSVTAPCRVTLAAGQVAWVPAVALAVGNTAGALLSVRFAIEAPGAIRWVVLAAVLVAVAAAWLR